MPQEDNNETFAQGFGKFFKSHWLDFLKYAVLILGAFGTGSYILGSYANKIDSHSVNKPPQVSSAGSIDCCAERERLLQENSKLNQEIREQYIKRQELSDIAIEKLKKAQENEK